MVGLKPCPFCGNTRPTVAHDLEGEINGIFCNRCKLLAKFPIEAESRRETMGETLEKWKTKWNSREAGFS